MTSYLCLKKSTIAAHRFLNFRILMECWVSLKSVKTVLSIPSPSLKPSKKLKATL